MSGLGGDGFAIDFGDLGLDEEPDTSGIEKAAEKIRNIIKGVLDFLDENKAKILAIMGGVAAFLIALKWPAIAASIGKIVMPLKKAFDWLKAFMSLASSEGILCLLEKRFVDVTIRYGVHTATIDRWKRILEIKEQFENQIGCSIYSLLPGIVENSFC